MVAQFKRQRPTKKKFVFILVCEILLSEVFTNIKSEQEYIDIISACPEAFNKLEELNKEALNN